MSRGNFEAYMLLQQEAGLRENTMNENDIKIQLVFGQAAHTDMRGDQPGKAEGDHRDTVFEFRVSADVAATILPLAEELNAEAIAWGEKFVAFLDDQGLRDKFVSVAGALTGESVADAKFMAPLVRVFPAD